MSKYVEVTLLFEKPVENASDADIDYFVTGLKQNLVDGWLAPDPDLIQIKVKEKEVEHADL